jgi:hypothetical protein
LVMLMSDIQTPIYFFDWNRMFVPFSFEPIPSTPGDGRRGASF